ncbi:MAG TPA: BatD family protein [Longimicrobiales bacterium]
MPGAALLLALVAAAGAGRQEAPRVWATLSEQSIPVGNTVVLELNVQTQGPAPDEITLPRLPSALEVVGTRDYSQFQFSLPGGRSRLVRREIVLRADAAGHYRIPPITVRIEGRRYQTQALALTVTAASGGAGGAARPGAAVARPPRSGGFARGPEDEVLFRAELTPDTAYVGQQVTLDAEVMISEDAQFRLRGAPEYLPPTASGFWVRDLPWRRPSESVITGGRIYRTRGFSRAYFPLAPGHYTLPPAELHYESRRSFFYSPQEHRLTTDSLRLVVLPIPEAGRPASFTGAVGRYEVRARLEPTEVPAGEAVALTLEIEGEGNIKAIPAPTLPALDGVEVHPPSEDADVRDVGSVVTGTKRFTWILIPRRPGRIELPAIEYAYFDPDRAAFEVARAEPLVLRVRAGNGVVAATPPPDRLRYLKPAPAGASALRWVRSPVFAAAQLLPLLALLGSVLWRRRRRRPPTPSGRQIRRRRREALDALRARVASDDFFRDLDDLVRDGLAERLGVPSLRKADPAALAAALEAHGVSRGTARALASLLERSAQSRYAPTPPGAAARTALLEEAGRLLDAADREGERPRRAAATTGILLLLAFALHAPRAAAAAGAQESAPQDFTRATELYDNGDYAGAVREFTAFVQAHPLDPHGWYNLGNAYFENDERGRAIWAWLRARNLAPRDRDVRYNLEHADVDPALLERTAAALPLTADELLLAASIAWLVAAAGAGWYFRRRRPAAALVGAAGLALALALLAAWARPRFGEAVGIVLPAEATLRAAPTARADPLGQLAAGAGVQIVEERADGWLRIRTRDDGEGWIEGGQVGRLRGHTPPVP